MRINNGSGVVINDGAQILIRSKAESFFSDKKLDNKELESLKADIYNSYMGEQEKSQPIKDQAVNFLTQINEKSKGGFLGIGGKISANELQELKNLASSNEMKGNPLVQQIITKLEAAISPQQSNVNVKNYDKSTFNPSTVNFNKNSFRSADIISQHTKLDSSSGDCGPSSAAMVLKSFGYLQNKDAAESITSVREACGVTSKRDGAWAIDEAEQAKAISKISGGQITKRDDITISSGSGNGTSIQKMVDFINKQTESGRKVVVETGSPYGGGSSGDGRHYMAVDRIVDMGADGKIFMLADSALGTVVPYSEKDMMEFINQTNKTTELLSYGRN